MLLPFAWHTLLSDIIKPNESHFEQTQLFSFYRHQASGVATGGHGGGRVPPWQWKSCQKLGKRGEKSGKNQRQKSGSFFHFAPPDR